MAERAPGARTPDSGALLGRGDADVPDFLAQQQGAADLSDFALQSTAGVVAGDASATPAASSLSATAAEDLTTVTVTNATAAVVADIVDPVGNQYSVRITPNGGFNQHTLAYPVTLVTADTFVRVRGGIQYHFVANAASAQFVATWYGGDGSPILGNLLSTSSFYIASTIDATNTDTWIHFDSYLSVPDNAVSVQYSILWTAAGVGTFQTTELMYVNNATVDVASTFPGVVSGNVSQRAAWWLPWGLAADPVSVTVAQTGITTEVNATGMTVSVPQIAGRRYKYTVMTAVSSTVAGDDARVKLTDGSGAPQLEFGQANCTTANSGYSVAFTFVETATATGTVTRKLRVLRQAGTGTISFSSGGATAPSFLLVEDIGRPVLPPPDSIL